MRELKIAICEAHILLCNENNEVGVNFTFSPSKIELLKLGVFDRPLVKHEINFMKLTPTIKLFFIVSLAH
jgi:hypothetical protein